jgi:PAS domain S-box-containing protein
MATQTATVEQLAEENAELRQQLEEAEQVIDAIRQGRVDAFVVADADREQIYTMETAERPYRVLVERMPQGAATLDEAGTILYCNARFAELIREPLGSLPGGSLSRWVAPGSRSALHRLLKEARGRQANRTELLLQRADGTVVPVYLAASPSPAGRAAVSLIITDLSEHKKLEQVLAADAELRQNEERLRRALEAARKAEEALREADRRKDEFLAVLAHELRNPLASIHLAVEFLQRETVANSAAWGQARAIIKRQVVHMARLVDDLLDVSRISRGKMLLRFQPTELVGLLRETLDNYSSLLKESGLHCSAALPAAPLWVVGDPTRLAQVVGNILHNARKFTERGGGIRVELAPEASGCWALLTISDTGIGMDPQTLAGVFERFGQARESQTTGRGGLGLGLALVKGLVELHGGQVWAESAGPGAGSTFTVRLPLTTAPAAEPAASTHPSGPRRPCRILIIEDDADAAESFRMLLESCGHEVAVTLDGAVGLELARRFRPEVVLCDLGLPGDLDGHAVARILRSEPDLVNVRLIALSGYGQEEDVRRSVQSGFDRHVTKPVSIDELQRIIGQLLVDG